ncbi:MAG: helix-turn-helix transcriptional regulator [Sedimentisphaerales bacterium]|nr:helix-turn-helix transcriptional regulator [Sedimentisphaerales bacterium]
MSDINKEVGLNIRKLREERGISQEKLAEFAGLHRTYIGQIERGEKNIGLKNLQKIAKALGVDLKNIF